MDEVDFDGCSQEFVDLFRKRMGFLGLVGIAFTCWVYLMTLLRPVLTPFLWALFLVTALHPLAGVFEAILLGLGRLLFCCGAGAASLSFRRRPCRLREAPLPTEVELSRLPDSSAEDAELWVLPDHPDVESACTGCCSCFSRVVAVTGALAVVLGVAGGLATLVVEAAVRVKENFGIYEKGAQNAVSKMKAAYHHVFGHLPDKIVEEIAQNVLASAKAILSDVFTELFAEASRALVEFAMLALYVMFWLCAPMPLNSKTERIFRRYLILKGTACTCYGIAVWILLSALLVELAPVFGLISFFLCFIPEVGAFIAMMLPVPVILFDSRLDAPFLTLLIATAGQLSLKFVFANIIEVKLVENDTTMKMHPVITLLAVTFFGFIWGPTGMLLSVPLMAYLKVVILSGMVPPSYRNPVLILLEGDRRAPERHRTMLAPSE